MITLNKMTIDYVDREDRIALIGEADDGRVVRIWLIRPLTRQLAVGLSNLLTDLQSDVPHAAAQAAFMQAAAEQTHKPTPAVKYVVSERVTSSKPASRGAWTDTENDWLVLRMDAKLFSAGMTISFFGADDEQAAGCGLSEELLRQWLGILRNVCQKANWIDADWPQWMKAPMTFDDSVTAN
jgi:hypothetical protein